MQMKTTISFDLSYLAATFLIPVICSMYLVECNAPWARGISDLHILMARNINSWIYFSLVRISPLDYNLPWYI
jgi:inner membrane protein involved in colicin E2 resistance